MCEKYFGAKNTFAKEVWNQLSSDFLQGKTTVKWQLKKKKRIFKI